MIHRHRIVLWSALFIAAAAPGAVAAGPVVKPLHVPMGTVIGQHFRVVVLADGYSAEEMPQFDLDAENLVVHQLMADPFYGMNGIQEHFTIQSAFQPTPSGSTSLFGIKIAGGIDKCYFQLDSNTQDLIEDAVADSFPAAKHVVVLKNDASTVGCSYGRWLTVVTSGNVNTNGVLEHEFGHLVAGLHDEYELDPGPYHPPPSHLYGPNCVTDRALAWWKAFPPSSFPTPPGAIQGCVKYGRNVWRPYQTCRMRIQQVDFCPVCKLEMSLTLKWVPGSASGAPTTTSPGRGGRGLSALDRARIVPALYVLHRPTQAPSQQPQSSVRLVVALSYTEDASGRRRYSASAVRSADVPDPAEKQYRRTGDFVYQIIEGSNTIETGVLTGDPFDQHAYGIQSAPHGNIATKSANVVLFIPNTTKADLRTRSLIIKFFVLNDSKRYDIDPTTFVGREFQAKLTDAGTVSMESLRSALKP